MSRACWRRPARRRRRSRSRSATITAPPSSSPPAWPAWSGPAAPAIPEPERYDYGSHLILAAGWAVLFGASGFLAQGRSSRALVPMLWGAAAVFAPLAMLVALYCRIAQLDRSLPFAALALLVAASFALATEALVKRAPRPGLMAASAMFATGTLRPPARPFP